MVKHVSDDSISSAIKEAKKRTDELEQMRRDYEKLQAAIGSDEVIEQIDKLDIKLEVIDEDIAWHARRKIKALCDMANYVGALAAMGERSDASRIIRRPIPKRRPRSEDVVTGKIYPNPAVACGVEGIKFDFRGLQPADAWLYSKGYPLRDVR